MHDMGEQIWSFYTLVLDFLAVNVVHYYTSPPDLQGLSKGNGNVISYNMCRNLVLSSLAIVFFDLWLAQGYDHFWPKLLLLEKKSSIIHCNNFCNISRNYGQFFQGIAFIAA